MTETTKEAAQGEDLRTNEKKWSKPLMEAGWTCIPSVIIERQKALLLDAIDINIIMHLASRWWTADGHPQPSKGTIADAMGISPRTVQKRIAEMEKAGLIRREERRISREGSKPNTYHLDGLIEQATPFAEEVIATREEKAAVRAARAKRKKPQLALVKK